MTVTEFFNSLESGATWSAGIAFKRSNPLPIDRYSVFKTEADALAYAKTNAVAYPGQVIATVSDKEAVVYVIAAVGTTGKIVKLAASSTAADISKLVSDLSDTVLAITTELGDDNYSSVYDPALSTGVEPTITSALLNLKAQLDKKVKSVKAADASIKIAGTATAPTVAAQLDPATGNALKLVAGKGLRVDDPAVTLTALNEATAGMLKTYELTQYGKSLGKIDIPKDFLVKSGSVETVTEEDVTETDKPYKGAKVGDKYIKLVINSKDSTTSTGDTALCIPAKDLVDVYTGVKGTKIEVTVHPDTNTISASIVAGSIAKTDLVTAVQTSLGKADTALQEADIKTGKTNGTIGVKGTDVAVKGLGAAAYKGVATEVTTAAETLPTAKAVADYVAAQIGDACAVYRYTE